MRTAFWNWCTLRPTPHKLSKVRDDLLQYEKRFFSKSNVGFFPKSNVRTSRDQLRNSEINLNISIL
jgi:hypothetical protein